MGGKQVRQLKVKTKIEGIVEPVEESWTIGDDVTEANMKEHAEETIKEWNESQPEGTTPRVLLSIEGIETVLMSESVDNDTVYECLDCGWTGTRPECFHDEETNKDTCPECDGSDLEEAEVCDECGELIDDCICEDEDE